VETSGQFRRTSIFDYIEFFLKPTVAGYICGYTLYSS
jgi:hypothetical protein